MNPERHVNHKRRIEDAGVIVGKHAVVVPHVEGVRGVTVGGSVVRLAPSRHTGTPGAACPRTVARRTPRPFTARSLEVMPPFAIRNRGRSRRRRTTSTKAPDT